MFINLCLEITTRLVAVNRTPLLRGTDSSLRHIQTGALAHTHSDGASHGTEDHCFALSTMLVAER